MTIEKGFFTGVPSRLSHCKRQTTRSLGKEISYILNKIGNGSQDDSAFEQMPGIL